MHGQEEPVTARPGVLDVTRQLAQKLVGHDGVVEDRAPMRKGPEPGEVRTVHPGCEFGCEAKGIKVDDPEELSN